MRYMEGFREGKASQALASQLEELGVKLEENQKVVRVMEVCGSHTMAIHRYGIRSLLPDNLKLISGPGCPVCVTDHGFIDTAIELCRRGVIIATFGDLIRVPGSEGSLAQLKGEGGRVEVCYSPLDALALAEKEAQSEVVFLGIGFETTMAPIISLVKRAKEEKLSNLSVLTAFKLVPPALKVLVEDPEVAIDGFLCPAHVSAIIGSDAYSPIVDQYSMPCVVAGFEPLDILLGLKELTEQCCDSKPQLTNQYARVVSNEGNLIAQELIKKYLKVSDESWRGIGVIPESGMVLSDEFAYYDASKRFSLPIPEGKVIPGCRCGEVLKGQLSPPDCPLFGKGCSPESPVGPCMVSSEGSCAAYYRYSRFS
ncbi:MAG: hydrogenase formation protein HypD [Planctomycetes bacterium]|nr:hydrogenase formation protein HypD [Planctomycetota bacterium]